MGEGAGDGAARFARYQRDRCEVPGLLTLDVSRMRFDDDFLARMEPALERAFDAMEALEAGAIANPDENRMVGHYWLRAPELAPDAGDRRARSATTLARRQGVRRRRARRRGHAAARRRASRSVLVDRHRRLGARPAVRRRRARRRRRDRMRRPLLRQHRPRRHRPRAGAARRARSARRSCVVISQERRHAGDAQRHARGRRGLRARPASTSRTHAVAVTGAGTRARPRRRRAKAGSRASRCGTGSAAAPASCRAVGLLPAALQGLDIDALLAGAARHGRGHARARHAREPGRAARARCGTTPAAAAARRTWSSCPTRTGSCCSAATSSSSSWSRSARSSTSTASVVNQGIAVYGNKGSTDQHAYVQQLRDGVHNFFVTFIEVLEDRGGAPLEVEPGVTAGDYLHGFLLGTRDGALRERPRVDHDHACRGSTPATHRRADRALRARGRLLRDRWSNINAYHQPGVEAGKKAAAAVLALQGAGAGRARGAGRRPREQIAGARPARPTRPRRSTCCSSTWPRTAARASCGGGPADARSRALRGCR